MAGGDRKIELRLTLVAIAVLPLMTVPIFPSDYRPLSIVFLLVPVTLAGLSLVVGLLSRFRVVDAWLLAFLAYAVLRSLVAVAASDTGLGSALFESALLAIGVLSFFCFRLAILHFGTAYVLRLFNTVGILLILYGTIELLAVYGPLPLDVRNSVSMLLTGKAGSRIQLTTSEAAWAARVLLPYLLVLWVLRKRMRPALFWAAFTAGVIVYVATLSAEGYLTLLATILLAGLLFPTWERLRLVFLFSICGVVFVMSVLVVATQFRADDPSYFASRLYKLQESPDITFNTLARLDESTYIRVNYPVISAEIFADHPVFGIGNGSYGRVFNTYISDRGNLPFQNSQIVTDIVNETGDPKNLPGRILAENGILGAGLALAFLIVLHRGLWARRHSQAEEDRVAILFYAAALAGGLQFGSLVFLQSWFLLAFASAQLIRNPE